MDRAQGARRFYGDVTPCIFFQVNSNMRPLIFIQNCNYTSSEQEKRWFNNLTDEMIFIQNCDYTSSEQEKRWFPNLTGEMDEEDNSDDEL